MASVGSSVSRVASYESTKKMVSMARPPLSNVSGTLIGWPAVAVVRGATARTGRACTACGSGRGRAQATRPASRATAARLTHSAMGRMKDERARPAIAANHNKAQFRPPPIPQAHHRSATAPMGPL